MITLVTFLSKSTDATTLIKDADEIRTGKGQ